MTLAVFEALTLNKSNQNLDMTLAVWEALSPNTPNQNLDMTLAICCMYLTWQLIRDVF